MSTPASNRSDGRPPGDEGGGSATDRPPPVVSAAKAGHFALRQGRHEIALGEGETIIGRGSTCAVILDEPLISRRHAALFVGGDRVLLRDLGSRNGVLVNDRTIDGEVVLAPGDRFRVGESEFELVYRSAQRLSERPDPRRAQTMSFQAVPVRREEATTHEPPPNDSSRPPPAGPPSSDDNTRQGHYIELIGGVAEKALALNRTDEAIRLLGTHLEKMAADARTGRRAVSRVAERAAEYAVRLCESTLDPKWLGIAIELYRAEQRPFPLDIIDRLHALLRRSPGAQRVLLETYVAELARRKETMPPAERFALQRLEGLARLAAL